MTSIIFRTRGTNTKETSVTCLIFTFKVMFIFRNLARLKQLIHIAPFRSKCCVLKMFVCLEVSNRVSN